MPYGRHGIQFKIENYLGICNLYGKMIGKISLLAIATTGPIRDDAYTTSGKYTLKLIEQDRHIMTEIKLVTFSLLEVL